MSKQRTVSWLWVGKAILSENACMEPCVNTSRMHRKELHALMAMMANTFSHSPLRSPGETSLHNNIVDCFQYCQIMVN
jgi:hypothetical protein